MRKIKHIIKGNLAFTKSVVGMYMYGCMFFILFIITIVDFLNDGLENTITTKNPLLILTLLSFILFIFYLILCSLQNYTFNFSKSSLILTNHITNFDREYNYFDICHFNILGPFDSFNQQLIGIEMEIIFIKNGSKETKKIKAHNLDLKDIYQIIANFQHNNILYSHYPTITW